ncbi:MAG TPA: hypothetical protein VGP22_15250 [Albitalea sp.]|jgi:hypothetical protein|nr:hypothetical protein [Albitalea sp.]
MNHASQSNATPTRSANDLVRELVAAMPIVIFAKALQAAFQRPPTVRAATLQMSQSR